MTMEQGVTPSAGRAPLTELRARIQRLHREAGEPSTRQLERQIGRGVISHTTVHGVLRCEKTPTWGPLELVVEALNGDIDEFQRLWQAVRSIEDPLQEPIVTEEFELYVDTLADRQAVRADDLPLRIEGRYSGPPPSVRVILEDSYQQYYLQNPPVRFQPDGTWTATNILPGEGITFVLFVAVDGDGKNMLDDMARRKQFAAFYELPSGSRILRSIAIVRE